MAHLTYRAWLIAVLFLAGISFPILNNLFEISPDLPSSENRQMAIEPILDINILDPFPKRYETYYNDHFTLRNRMVEWHTKIQFDFFRTSPIPDKAIIGNDDWYFMAGNEQDAYLGRRSPTPKQLELAKRELEYRQDFLEKLGSKFYFMIAPVKNGIYSNKQPSMAYPLTDRSWGEQLTDYLIANSRVRVINVFDTLKANRDKAQLYYKYDNHWNGQGAFYAAREALRRVNQDFPDVVVPNIADFDIKRDVRKIANIITMFGAKIDFEDSTFKMIPKGGYKANYGKEADYPIVYGFAYRDEFEEVKVLPDSTKPKLLLISDSFGHDIFPVFAESFSKTVKIFDCWQFKLNENIAMTEKADVVILMVMEGNMRNMAEFPSHLMPHIDPLGPIPIVKDHP